MSINPLESKINSGQFINMMELVPARDLDLDAQINKLKSINNIEFFGVVDSPLSRPMMSPIALCHKIEMAGRTSIMHLVCRDRNLIALEADVLAAYALGIKNILALTGDPVRNAKGVFEFSSIGLIDFIQKLNLKKSINCFVGEGINTNAKFMENEIKRTIDKIGAGAKYVITQPCFDIKKIEKTCDAVSAPIIAGVIPVFEVKTAEFINENINGIEIPDEVIALMENREKVIDYYCNLIVKLKKTKVSGICIQGIKEDNYDVVNRLI